MDGIAAEVSHKLKSAIKAKLVELGAYVDDVLSNYVMVMVTNRRSKAEMDRELQLFLGANTSTFTSWLQSVWMKLEQVTVTNSGFENTRRKGSERKKKVKRGSKSSSESDDDKKRKKKRKLDFNETLSRDAKKRKLSKITTSNLAKPESFSEDSAFAKSPLEEKTCNSAETMSETEIQNFVPTANKKRSSVVSAVDEEDFLNIKDDFDSEFLSDNECSDMKLLRDDVSKLPKTEADDRLTGMISDLKKTQEKFTEDDVRKTEDNSEELESHTFQIKADRKSSVNSQLNVGTKEGGVKTSVIVRKVKLPPQSVENLRSTELSRTGEQKSKLLSSTRPASASRSRSPSSNRSRSRSMSETVSATKLPASRRSPSRSPSPGRSKFNRRIHPSVSPSCVMSSTKQVSPSFKSYSAIAGSAVVAKFARIRERSPSMVDARELINRKRAMVHANDKLSKDQFVSRKNINSMKDDNVDDRDVEIVEKSGINISVTNKPTNVIRIKKRDRSKENVNADSNGDNVSGGDSEDDKNNDGLGHRNFERSSYHYNHNGSSSGGKSRRRELNENFTELDGQTTTTNTYSRFVVSKRDGKRRITVRPAVEEEDSDTNSSLAVATARSFNRNPTANSVAVIDDDDAPPLCNISEFRTIKRTVYTTERNTSPRLPEAADDDNDIGNGNDDDDDNDAEIVRILDDDNNESVMTKKEDKFKLRKSVLNRINKYIQEEPILPGCCTKPIKIQRTSKLTTVPMASDSLIRKAVAEAHKSRTYSKEESGKKKETSDSCNLVSSQDRHKNKDDTVTNVEYPILEDDIRPTSKEDIGDANMTESRMVDSADKSVKIHTPDNASNDYSPLVDAEEYDPSRNMPQFVVTLTGLDRKLYSHEDVEPDLLDQDLDGGKLKLKSQERCKFYPNCLAGDQCLFYHPVIPCKMFPNCKYGNNCLYVHPKCKFDILCTRYDCNFQHSAPKISAPVNPRHVPSSVTAASQPCKFYYNCVNPLCPFQHPKICRFDRFCTNRNCTFSHTSLSHISTVSKDKLKWCKPKNNESKPESAEQKQENSVMNEN